MEAYVNPPTKKNAEANYYNSYYESMRSGSANVMEIIYVWVIEMENFEWKWKKHKMIFFKTKEFFKTL